MLLYRPSAYDGVTTVSACPEMIIVGTRSLARFDDGEYGVMPATAFNDGRRIAALSAPPPPIE